MKIFIALLAMSLTCITVSKAVPNGWTASGNSKGGEAREHGFLGLWWCSCHGANGTCAAEYTDGTSYIWVFYPTAGGPVETSPLSDGTVNHTEMGVDNQGLTVVTYYFNN